MDIHTIIKDLRSEREAIERAIIAVERIGLKRRGRPPQWMKALEAHMAGRRKKLSKKKGN